MTFYRKIPQARFYYEIDVKKKGSPFHHTITVHPDINNKRDNVTYQGKYISEPIGPIEWPSDDVHHPITRMRRLVGILKEKGIIEEGWEIVER